MSSKKEKTNRDRKIKRKDKNAFDYRLPAKQKIKQIEASTTENKSVFKNYSKETFLEDLEEYTKDLIYISETDAEIFPFAGQFAEDVTKEDLLSQIGLESKTRVEETKFEDFFRHPSKVQDWFDEERTATAKKYQLLKKLMEENLKDIKVFKVGKLDLEIYIVGLDSENNLIGIKTKATET